MQVINTTNKHFQAETKLFLSFLLAVDVRTMLCCREVAFCNFTGFGRKLEVAGYPKFTDCV